MSPPQKNEDTFMLSARDKEIIDYLINDKHQVSSESTQFAVSMSASAPRYGLQNRLADQQQTNNNNSLSQSAPLDISSHNNPDAWFEKVK